MRLHTILFATDFSGRDRAAFQAACRLAQAWQGDLIVLHVQDPRFEAFPKSKRLEPAVEFKKYIPENLSTTFQHVLKIGDADKEILKMMEETPVDMIVLGTHGRAGMDRVFSGSIAESVMRKANCPVMTIRESVSAGEKDKPKILVPVDFSVYGYAALDFATRIALEIGATISIVYVDNATAKTKDSDTSERQNELRSQLKEFKPQNERVKFTHKLFSGDPAEEIYKYANSKEYDYVIIGTHGRSGLGRAILGSVAEQVVRHTNCPVIAVKPSNRRSSVPTQ